MTEPEKMTSGLLYNAADPTLEAERSRCKELCHQANQIPPLQRQARNASARHSGTDRRRLYHRTLLLV